jgi:nicotinamidase-related amidase
MSLVDAHRSVLVLVDFQQRLMPAIHRADEVVAEALRLADAARELGIRVVGTEQNPGGLGPGDEAIRQRCDAMLAKMHFDACADGLAALLKAEGGVAPTHAVVAGCEAHVCLLQTALGLLDAGLQVWVAAPGCGSRRPRDHELAMARLRQAGAVVVSTEMVIFEWLRTCEHERFRAVLQVVKRPGGDGGRLS